MSESAILPVLSSVLSRLRGDTTGSPPESALMVMVNNAVLHDVPQNHPTPYLAVGMPTERPSHTFRRNGRVVTVQLQAVSVKAGITEAAVILNRAIELLDNHVGLVVNGFSVVGVNIESSRSMVEQSSAGGKIYHLIAMLEVEVVK